MTAMTAAVSDSADFERMRADDEEIGRLLHALEQRHLMDISAPVMAAISRLDGLLEAVRLELRLIENYLGGTP